MGGGGMTAAEEPDLLVGFFLRMRNAVSINS